MLLFLWNRVWISQSYLSGTRVVLINAYVDKVRYFTFKNERLTDPHKDWRQWPFDRDFRLLLNVAVGGNWGGQKGVDDSVWPQRMEVDYVRVMQLQ